MNRSMFLITPLTQTGDLITMATKITKLKGFLEGVFQVKKKHLGEKHEDMKGKKAFEGLSSTQISYLVMVLQVLVFIKLFVPSDQIRSVTQSCPTLFDPMNHSTRGLPVHHQLPEFIQTHVHRGSDAIQPSHPLSSPSPLAPNPSQHQSLFQ